MTDTQQGISVGCTKDEVCVRVVGRGTFQNSQPLRRFALDCIERGYHQFIIDIGGCPTMDSTFLGVLAGIGLRLRRNGSADIDRVSVINVSPKNLQLIRTLGLDRLLVIQAAEESDTAETVQLPSGCHLDRLPESDIEHLTRPLDRDETTNLMINSHDNLVAADKRNATKFNEVTKFLRKTVDRKKTE